MLLPSALSCDPSGQTSHQSHLRTSLFASPPLSPPSSSAAPALNNLYSTCRALQSMLSPPTQLPSPPTQHAEVPSSPFKLRLRARKTGDDSAVTPRKKITKRAAAPPRGINKRRRALADDGLGRDDESAEEDNNAVVEEAPRTPKRQRLAPPVLPLGLERGDFHALHQAEVGEGIEGENGETDAWSTEEDRMLVELVLEKLKLTKSDWQDCARSLGKDRGSVGRRWKSLMASGDIGLKQRQGRRARLHSTWR